mmetsp:Transcript_68601/g.135698  ORF Transcript_68601/g.135698 Transcript_68601/m.135698 type:complete len:396 (-) Transcript_68601:128-1315(-)
MGNMVEKCIVFPAPSVTAAGGVESCANIVWDRRATGSPAGGVWRPFLWLEVPGAELTVIYFHANAEDLAGMSDWVSELAQELSVNLLAVEFPGYGLLQSPEIVEDMESVEDIIRGIDNAAVHAVRFLIETQGIASNQVVLHGRSLGCGPTLRLAKYMRDQMQLNLGGIVLQSPSISIQQVASDWLGAAASLLVPDYYHNLSVLTQLCRDAAPTTQVGQWIPILIVHGAQDNVIQPYHAWTLYQEAVAHGHPSVVLSIAALSGHQQWDLYKDLACPIGRFFADHVVVGRARLQQAETEGREVACGEAERNNSANPVPVSRRKRPGRVLQDCQCSQLCALTSDIVEAETQICHNVLAGSLVEAAKDLEVSHHGGKRATEMLALNGSRCLQELCLLPL